MPQSKKPKKAFALRLDPALHECVERLAAQELRSVNSELEMLIREALERRGIRVPDSSGGAPPGAGQWRKAASLNARAKVTFAAAGSPANASAWKKGASGRSIPSGVSRRKPTRS